MTPYLPYWGKAKPFDEHTPQLHLLAYHCLDVVAVGHHLLEQHPTALAFFAHQLHLDHTRTRNLLCFLLGIHDLGKFSSRHFQSKSEIAWQQLQPGKPRSTHASHPHHVELGMLVYLKLLSRSWFDEQWFQHQGWVDSHYTLDDFFKPLVQAVIGHHGHPPKGTGHLDMNQVFSTDDLAAIKRFCQALYTLFPVDLSTLADSDRIQPMWTACSQVLAGFTILCDWLGSNQRFFPYCDQPQPLADYWHHAQKAACEAFQQVALVPQAVGHETGIDALFGFPNPSPLQRLVSTIPLGRGPQCFFIEDLTGSGKTEAALVLAHRLMAANLARGFYFGLPTMATADQMFERVAEALAKLFLGPTTLGLSHGKRTLSQAFLQMIGLEAPPRELDGEAGHDTGSGWCSEWMADHPKKSLLTQVGVGTVDQAMLAVMQARHHGLRLWGLIGKVLILDEIHAYDSYMLSILKHLLRVHTHFGGSTILLSATLPLEMRAQLARAYRKGLGEHPRRRPRPGPTELGDPTDAKPTPDQAFPLLSHLQPNQATAIHSVAISTRRTITIRLIGTEPDEQLIAWAAQGQCVCWVRNSVDDAKDAFARLLAHPAVDRNKLVLFHARFALDHRLAIQNDLLARFGKTSDHHSRAGWIVIATQVIEQSLDVDFDQLVSDLAPIDLLIQRMGRQMRHPRDATGRVHQEPNTPDARGTQVCHIAIPARENPPSLEQLLQTPALKRTMKVYPYHDLLLLTYELLNQRREIILPDQTRDLIETVYDPATIRGEALEKAMMSREADMATKRNQAQIQLIKLERGYTFLGHFEEPDRILTRLGLPSVTLRLALWQNNQLAPLIDHPTQAWPRSELRVLEYQAPTVDLNHTDYAQAFQASCEQVEDGHRRVRIIPLTKVSSKPQPRYQWIGDGWTVTYCPVEGYAYTNVQSGNRGANDDGI